jgi:hypothetical protein
MTPSDRDVLLSLGIHSEVDLRCPDEMAEMPSHWGSARMNVAQPFLVLCDPALTAQLTLCGTSAAEVVSASSPSRTACKC